MNERLAMFFFAALLCAFALLPSFSLAMAAPDRQNEAASLYESGEYKAAYKQYLKLAKDGDTFAQYRVSFMRLTGLGTKEKISEAMAWAVLASQGGDADLTRYRDAVAELVPADKRKSVETKATRYVRRWGSDDAPDDAAPVGASGVECTGSRLMRHCKTGSSSTSVHISWREDHSGEPALLDRIDALDQIISEHFSEAQAPEGDS